MDQKKSNSYAERYKVRRRVSRKLFPDSDVVLTWPEIWAIEKDKERPYMDIPIVEDFTV